MTSASATRNQLRAIGAEIYTSVDSRSTLAVCNNNNYYNNNNRFSIAPYGHNFRGADTVARFVSNALPSVGEEIAIAKM